MLLRTMTEEQKEEFMLKARKKIKEMNAKKKELRKVIRLLTPQQAYKMYILQSSNYQPTIKDESLMPEYIRNKQTLKTVRQFCVECSSGYTKADKCDIIYCPFHNYRKGKMSLKYEDWKRFWQALSEDEKEHNPNMLRYQIDYWDLNNN